MSTFALPTRLAGKAAPALISTDETHFATLAAALAREVASTEARLDLLLSSPGGSGQAALERDLEIHAISARLRLLRRYGVDACLGRMTYADGESVYLGRIGLGDGEGGRLLVDWRAPGAAPFFSASHAEPMGLASRRRYRWLDRKVVDYWDEVFDLEALDGIESVALDDQSAFIASLGAARSSRMRDVLATIQADQDAIIRASARGALVVDGGPGTGKTVVALHRAAYLIYADPRLARDRGGVLFVGPHAPYLAYVEDVLPSLGGESVVTCMLEDLRASDAEAPALERRRRARANEKARELAAEKEVMERVIDDLIAAGNDDLMLATMLRGKDAQNSLEGASGETAEERDALAGPFAHIIVDEAQELGDADWEMLVRRCPSRSFTIVGDRAQARHGFTESWEARLARVGLRDVRVTTLTVNYRTPVEVMSLAGPEIRAVIPDANVPTSIRETGVPVRFGSTSELGRLIDRWLAENPDGVAAVIGDAEFAERPRVRSLPPVLAKGLEFDFVVLVRPADFGDDLTGGVDRYVAMTRATRELAILT